MKNSLNKNIEQFDFEESLRRLRDTRELTSEEIYKHTYNTLDRIGFDKADIISAANKISKKTKS